MIFQSNNISKFLGKTDVKVNKTSGEMMAVPKVGELKNKERNEKFVPKGGIKNCYYTDLQGRKIEEFFVGQEIFLVIESENSIGKIVNIDLSDNTKDFEYQGKTLENDILKNIKIIKDVQQEKLRIITQK